MACIKRNAWSSHHRSIYRWNSSADRALPIRGIDAGHPAYGFADLGCGVCGYACLSLVSRARTLPSDVQPTDGYAHCPLSSPPIVPRTYHRPDRKAAASLLVVSSFSASLVRPRRRRHDATHATARGASFSACTVALHRQAPVARLSPPGPPAASDDHLRARERASRRRAVSSSSSAAATAGSLTSSARRHLASHRNDTGSNNTVLLRQLHACSNRITVLLFFSTWNNEALGESVSPLPLNKGPQQIKRQSTCMLTNQKWIVLLSNKSNTDRFGSSTN
jgi:hypothetical protein